MLTETVSPSRSRNWVSHQELERRYRLARDLVTLSQIEISSDQAEIP